MRRQAGITAGVLLAVGALGWWLATSNPRGKERPEAAAPGSPPTRLPILAAEPELPATHPARESPEPDAPPADPVAPEPAPAPEDPHRAWLTGTVLDADGATLAGAAIDVLATHSSDNTLFFQHDRGFHARLERAARATSGADGRFRVELPRGVPFDLEVSAAGHAEGFVPLCQAGEDVLVRLDAPGAVHGTLTRATDGAPIADALVRVFHWPSYAAREAHSASDGTYRVLHPFRDGVYVEVLPLAEEAVQWTWLELDAERSARRDFALAPGVAVTGRVVELESGRPIEGALVGEGWQMRRRATTDAEGRYRLAGIGGPGAYGLVARARGRGEVKRLELPPVVDGVIRVDFELPRAWSATGRVVDRAGRPVPGARITAGGSRVGPDGAQTTRAECVCDADGAFRLEDLTPGLTHWLSASATGFARARFPVPEPPPGSEVSALGDLVLPRAALISGRVRGPDGNPLAYATVKVESADAWREAPSDALGRFAFGDLPAGSYRVRGVWYGRPLEPTLEVALAEGALREGIELFLPRGLAIAGRVSDEDGRGIAGVNVHAELAEGTDPELELLESFFERTDIEGRFRFDDVPGGKYWIYAAPRAGVAADPDAPFLDESTDAVAGAAPVEIVLRRGTVIRGRVLDASGAPLFNHSVVGRAPGSEGRGTLISGTDALGRFELAVARDTTWTLVVSGPAQSGGSTPPLLEVPGIAAGCLDVVLRLEPR